MNWFRPFRPLLLAVERLFDRFLCVAGAALFSQAPEFMQQYLQRLGGRLDEARRQLGQLADTAAQSGLSVDQLGAHAAASADPAVSRLAVVIRDSSERVQSLASAETAIREASAFSRPFVFLRHFDPQIAHSTWAVFKPALPTTAEGAAYALVGMAAALALYHWGLKRTVIIATRRGRPVPARADSATQVPRD